MKTPILRIIVPSPLRRSFDYLAPAGIDLKQLKPGIRIKVPWRNENMIGILQEVVATSAVPKEKLKTAELILDREPLLPDSLFKLLIWAADYYHHPIGEVFATCLPNLLRTSRAIEIASQTNTNWQINSHSHSLNDFQAQAINTIKTQSGFKSFLLEGVTGSGKTEVYLQVIAEKIAANQQALVLVPEIGLTPQIVARFTERFSAPICLLHSGLTDRERMQAWLQAKSGNAAIIIGTRSAIFTPLKNPGIIIMDEEHDLSYKQQSGFRYSARDVALMRGQLENIAVVLGSATPALESLANSQRQKYFHLHLPQRAGTAVAPTLHIADIRKQSLQAGLAPTVINSMQQHLAAGNQILLFLNRRGFAPLLLCHACGWIAQCKRCDVRLTLHQQIGKLICHHCEAQQKIPLSCAHCQSDQLVAIGLGTERLEKNLSEYFPNTTITRIDRDNTRRKGSLQALLEKIQQGESQILLGTQMLTKGHHFPNVTLVVIVDADYYLFSNDFRASERLGQMIIQVAGRAGRAEKLGEVYIQTHHPDHPLLLQLINDGYATFAKSILQEREITTLPPFSYMALLRAEATQQTAPLDFLTHAAKEIKLISPHLHLLGPVAAPLAKKAGKYRAQLFISANQRKDLQNLLKSLLIKLETLKIQRKVRWSLDVDPLEIF